MHCISERRQPTARRGTEYRERISLREDHKQHGPVRMAHQTGERPNSHVSRAIAQRGAWRRGDRSHSLMCAPVSACRALRIMCSRSAPGGSDLAVSRNCFASSARRSSRGWACLKRRRCMSLLLRYWRERNDFQTGHLARKQACTQSRFVTDVVWHCNGRQRDGETESQDEKKKSKPWVHNRLTNKPPSGSLYVGACNSPRSQLAVSRDFIGSARSTTH